MWLSGPHDAAKQDISVFRGAQNEDDDRDNWDRNALLWQLEEDEHLVFSMPKTSPQSLSVS